MDVGGKEWGKWGIIPRLLLWMTEWVLGILGTWKVGRPWSYPNDGSCTEVAIKRETEFSTPSLFNASLHLLRMYYVPSFVLISMLHFLTKIETSRHRIFFFFKESDGQSMRVWIQTDPTAALWVTAFYGSGLHAGESWCSRCAGETCMARVRMGEVEDTVWVCTLVLSLGPAPHS